MSLAKGMRSFDPLAGSHETRTRHGGGGTGQIRAEDGGLGGGRGLHSLPSPARRPPLEIDGRLRELLGAAKYALSRLELAGEVVPSVEWFIYAFVRKEAVISSQIEGTQATLVDLLNYEAGAQSEPQNEIEVREVCHYLGALIYGRKQLHRKDGLPPSARLLNETHRRLMKGERLDPSRIRCTKHVFRRVGDIRNMRA